jgi:hypothetical protein
LLTCGFRRFVAHRPNAKVRGNTRQLSDRVYVRLGELEDLREDVRVRGFLTDAEYRW